MNPSMFLKFAEVSFKKEITYRFDYLVGIVNGFLYIFIFTSLWKAVFSVQTGGGFTKEGIISYAIVAMAIRISFSMDDTVIPKKVRDGSVSIDLIRPTSFFMMNLAESAGYSAFHLLARGLPIMAVSGLLFGLALPGHALPAGAVSLALSYLILFMLNYTTALLAFWFTEIFPFMLFKYALLNLFGGGMIPMDFFPGWLRGILAFLPFQHIFYTPAAIITGKIGGEAVYSSLAAQGMWVAGLGIVCTLMWRAGSNKLVIQGG